MAAAAAILRVSWRARAQELLAPVGVAALAGSVAGLLVGGIGGRIAMRVAGAMSDPSLVGAARTANGNIVGDITFGGSFFLLIAGLVEGLAFGLIFALVRPWLRPLGRWAGLAFGCALLAALGEVVLEPFNIDFRKFGVAPVNVALFALLFLFFGVVLDFIVTRIERLTQDAPTASRWRLLTMLALLPVGVMLVALAVALLAYVARVLTGTVDAGISTGGDGRGLILPVFLVAVVAARVLFGRAFDNARSLALPQRIATYGLVLVPAILGAPVTVGAIRFLVR